MTCQKIEIYDRYLLLDFVDHRIGLCPDCRRVTLRSVDRRSKDGCDLLTAKIKQVFPLLAICGFSRNHGICTSESFFSIIREMRSL